MPDTLDAVIVGAGWTDLNVLTGIAVGSELTIQPIGGPNDVVDIAISIAEPAVDFDGVRLEQNDFYMVPGGENTVWVRYIRLDRSDVGTRVTKLQVQP